MYNIGILQDDLKKWKSFLKWAEIHKINLDGVDDYKQIIKDLTIKVSAFKRLEELRKAINAENISIGEIAELQSLVPFVDSGDVQLLEWAGVPEKTK